MDPERKKEIRREYYLKGSMIFLLIAVSVIFAFCIFRYGIMWRHISRILNVLKPIIFGIAIAYVINPIVEFIDKGLSKLFGRFKHLKYTEKITWVISVLVALVIFLLLIVLCFYLIIPGFVSSISDLVVKLPQQATSMTQKITNVIHARGLSGVANDVLGTGEKWVKDTLVPRMTKWVTEFSWASPLADGIGAVFGFVKNFLIGIICAIYLLINKTLFLRQSRKLVCAVFKPKMASNVLQACKKANSIFSGFINGKLLDSLIIGVLCFIGVSVLRIPYPMLISVVIGITNIIPVFGPYIGAVPCFALTFLSKPVSGITFLVFIILLQTLDGNFIGPKILGDKTGIETFWVVFAITVGGGLFGVFGMLIGVPTFAVFYYLLRSGVNYLLQRKNLPLNSNFYTEDVKEKLQTASLISKTENETESETEAEAEEPAESVATPESSC
ncbi:MAG: AI-2E family transporter [Clostridia bacterium]|nr:AI-2E family transporter [Clostridia bacterium]